VVVGLHGDRASVVGVFVILYQEPEVKYPVVSWKGHDTHGLRRSPEGECSGGAMTMVLRQEST